MTACESTILENTARPESDGSPDGGVRVAAGSMIDTRLARFSFAASSQYVDVSEAPTAIALMRMKFCSPEPFATFSGERKERGSEVRSTKKAGTPAPRTNIAIATDM